MKTRVIFNPHAGNADTDDALRAAVAAEPDADLCTCNEAGHGLRLARTASAEGYDLVVAAGGDGTVNEVVNGLASDFDKVALGVVPLGTGNDLARTLAIPEDPSFAFRLALHGHRRPLDLIRVIGADNTVYAANVCAGGFTGELDDAMTEEMKAAWGPLSYLIGTVKALPDLADFETWITWDDAEPERVEALNIVVANGRTAAGGRPAAPLANPEDGLLDVVVVKNCSAPELAALAARALASDYLDSEHVIFRRARRLRVESRPGMWFNVDGELHTNEPVTFEVVPGALRVAVGPSYSATPQER
jgi:diacylglycerol kinase (ATP)